MSWQGFLNLLGYAGYLSTILVLGSVVATVVLWFRGIVPAMWRLGTGLALRKIAIFASGDAMTGLETLLQDSRLFRAPRNIVRVPSTADIGAVEAKGATLFLMHWPTWSDALDAVLAAKDDSTALIVYAPQEHGRIPEDCVAKLNQHRNVVVNNFRGRLLNDIVSSMITTSYERK